MGLVTPACAAIWSIEAPGPSRLITVMADSIKWARWVDRRLRRSVSRSLLVALLVAPPVDRRDRGMLPMVTLLAVTSQSPAQFLRVLPWSTSIFPAQSLLHHSARPRRLIPYSSPA